MSVLLSLVFAIFNLPPFPPSVRLLDVTSYNRVGFLVRLTSGQLRLDLVPRFAAALSVTKPKTAYSFRVSNCCQEIAASQATMRLV